MQRVNEQPQDVVCTETLAIPKQIFCSQCGARLSMPGRICENCSSSVSSDASSVQIAEKRQSLKTTFLVYFSILGVFIFTAIARYMGNLNEVQSDFVAAGWMMIWVGIWSVRYFKLIRQPLTCLGSLKWYFWAGLAGIVTALIATVNVGLFNSFLELEPYLYNKPYIEAGYGWWVVFAMICIEPPIFEEIAFRGIILNNLQNSCFGVREAIVVSSLLFAILHLNIFGMPFLFICGLGMAYFRLKSGSLYPSMLMHFAHNTTVITGEYFNWF